MGGELGNEIYIDLLVSSGLSPPSFILIENNNFYTNLVSKSWCLFLGFRGYLGEIGSGEKKEFFTYVFFSHKQWCVRVSASIFVAQLALVHELRLSEAFYVLWLAQLVRSVRIIPWAGGSLQQSQALRVSGLRTPERARRR